MTTAPKWYKIITVIALIWNLFGCLAVLSDLMMKPEDIARLSADQQALYASRTAWSMTANAVAVLGGVVGSLGLYLRKRWYMPFLIASFICLIIQDYGLFIVANGAALAGPAGFILQGMVLLIALLLIVLGRSAEKRGWISGNSSQ
jgi:hypothetical protein